MNFCQNRMHFLLKMADLPLFADLLICPDLPFLVRPVLISIIATKEMPRMMRILNVAEKNDAAKCLAEVMSNGRFNRVMVFYLYSFVKLM